MQNSSYHIRQLLDELEPPDTGKKSLVVIDNENAKVVLFAFAADAGLAEHVAPFPAIIQVLQGEAQLTVGDEEIFGGAGTWIQMAVKTPHSIMAKTPLTMLLTLLQ